MHYYRTLMTSVQLFVYCLLVASLGVAQSTPSLPDRREGINVNVFSVAAAKPLRLRVVFNVKAEATSVEKAMERLVDQMDNVKTQLEKLGAEKDSIEFSDIQSGPTPVTNGLLQMASNAAGNVNGQFAVIQLQAGAGGAVQVRSGQPGNAPQNEAYQIPRLYVATTIASADWDVRNKSKAEMTVMKFRLMQKIDERQLNGKHLTQSYTPEEEDEIFERTNIDVRNPATLAQWALGAASVEQAMKSMYICEISEDDFNAALKEAFKISDKYAKQIAEASGVVLGGIENITISVAPTYTGPNAPYQVYASAAGYYSGYPSPNSNWEPALRPYQIRLDNLGQISQKVEIFARYKIK
jgi:uncharacterized protein YggE